jgi:hypothetical protein
MTNPDTALPADIAAAIERLTAEASADPDCLSISAETRIKAARAALNAAILARLAAAEAERDEAEAYAREVGAALVGLTCDGSEFYRRGGKDWRVDPAACADYIRRQRADKHDSILRFAKRAKDAEAARDAALARAERLEAALEAVIGFAEGRDHYDAFPRDKAEKQRRLSDCAEVASAALAPAAEEAKPLGLWNTLTPDQQRHILESGDDV